MVISLNTLNYGNTAIIIEAAFLCLASLVDHPKGHDEQWSIYMELTNIYKLTCVVKAKNSKGSSLSLT